MAPFGRKCASPPLGLLFWSVAVDRAQVQLRYEVLDESFVQPHCLLPGNTFLLAQTTSADKNSRAKAGMVK
ncbi:hypothetical protein ColTof4_02067 [Colletotrichum tofieldiae]|nr:hypothetical protein ColTof3_09648 [Colletotrichum tofieldiae]GKT69644.1 hypothetical protein ColTof4_02067 [Colletotrichum tofieldiae]GKT92538.1 hypothetical protein Ct61P_10388 [Colletotrichum tofieldiae]